MFDPAPIIIMLRHKDTGNVGRLIKSYINLVNSLTTRIIKLSNGRHYFAPADEFEVVPKIELQLDAAKKAMEGLNNLLTEPETTDKKIKCPKCFEGDIRIIHQLYPGVLKTKIYNCDNQKCNHQLKHIL
jgi:hypothetical protein